MPLYSYANDSNEFFYFHGRKTTEKIGKWGKKISKLAAGDIRAYIEHTLKPIIEFKDSNPLQIKYFGFSSLGQSLARYFYDCRNDEVYTKSQLQSQCQHVDTTSDEHTQFHRIPDNSITDTDQHSIEIPLYLAASHDAHILLASDNSFNSIRNGYEFGSYSISAVSDFCLFLSRFFFIDDYNMFRLRHAYVPQLLVTMSIDVFPSIKLDINSRGR